MDRVTEYVEMWKLKGYPVDIPDEAPLELESEGLVPSYRLIAKALLSNDLQLLSLGFAPKRSIYYDILKKIEHDRT